MEAQAMIPAPPTTSAQSRAGPKLLISVLASRRAAGMMISTPTTICEATRPTESGARAERGVSGDAMSREYFNWKCASRGLPP